LIGESRKRFILVKMLYMIAGTVLELKFAKQEKAIRHLKKILRQLLVCQG